MPGSPQYRCTKPDCGHGSCVANGGGHVCNCSNGWFGDICNHDHDPCAGVDCKNQSGVYHSTGVCSGNANGLNHTCACEAGFLGDHCAGVFVLSGAHEAAFNGAYAKTAHVCHGKPVYQKGADGYVLLRPNGSSIHWDDTVWMVSYGTNCEDKGNICSSGGCSASPDGAGCAGEWQELDNNSTWHPNPSLAVVASRSAGE
jgi:hypothetical protein